MIAPPCAARRKADDDDGIPNNRPRDFYALRILLISERASSLSNSAAFGSFCHRHCVNEKSRQDAFLSSVR